MGGAEKDSGLTGVAVNDSGKKGGTANFRSGGPCCFSGAAIGFRSESASGCFTRATLGFRFSSAGGLLSRAAVGFRSSSVDGRFKWADHSFAAEVLVCNVEFWVV